ncbi:hypothetical protein [Plasmodium yoelii yoelii]|uniref:Uncharacterized protein n=1 Tax=Plasmodium yoelii yoelii TaxID=73239 RepID=Q7RJN8_PLAYO|nr:hypothetical protein [Plasmodium yoelii yoelii]
MFVRLTNYEKFITLREVLHYTCIHTYIHIYIYIYIYIYNETKKMDHI